MTQPHSMPRDEGSPSGMSTSVTLLQKLRDNHPEAWRRIHFIYGPLLRFWCAGQGVRDNDADDILQDVFGVVMKNNENFRHDRPGDTFRGWLRGITRNLIMEHARKKKSQPLAEGGTDAGRRFQQIPDLPPLDEDDSDEQKAALLHRTLEWIREEFSVHHWEIFRLTVMEKRTATEVALQLGVTAMAVRKAKSRILRRVRKELGNDECIRRQVSR
jgi:RNA polymerase sigma-70 factor (ECF subfamily)